MCGGAAGAIQNLSREEKSRAMLTAFGVVEPLADLLVGRHVKSQVTVLQQKKFDELLYCRLDFLSGLFPALCFKTSVTVLALFTATSTRCLVIEWWL